MQGALSRGLVPGILRDVYVARRTGRLTFRRGEEQCSLRFERGHVVYARASTKELHLGEVMVARGLLTADALDRATELVLRERKRLGQVLEELGIVDRGELQDALAIHVRAILRRVFSWPDGEWELEETDALEQGAWACPLKESTGEMIVQAVREIEDPAQVRDALGDPARVLLPSADPLLRFQRLTLTPVDGFVLSRVDGTLSARDVLALIPLPAEEVERSLLCLLATGMIEYAAAPAPPRRDSAQLLRQEIVDLFRALPDRNHFELLSVPLSASTAEIEAAFRRLAKRYHPDVHHDPALTDLRDKLDAIFARVTEAHTVLAHAGLRAAYQGRFERAAGAEETARHAEDMYLRAEDRFEEGKYWEAVALLGEVIPRAREKLKVRARLLLARAYLKYPDKVKDAERELLAAVQEEPASVAAYMLLGGLYKRSGLSARAASAWRKVLELHPHDAEARAELDALATARPRPDPRRGA